MTKTESRATAQVQAGNPLHGVTLQRMLDELLACHGWEGLARQIDIRCFTHEPSIGSSLKFLRRTPWARQQVESLYLRLPRPSPKDTERIDSR